MKFTEKLLKHPEFLRLQKRVQQMEQERIYCHHELSHALDVCRMAWMMYLEDRIQENLRDRSVAGTKNDFRIETKNDSGLDAVSKNKLETAESRKAEYVANLCEKKGSVLCDGIVA